MKKFKISIIVEVEDQSVEDMEYNAQQYIKDDIEDDALYIEDIEEVKPDSDPEPESIQIPVLYYIDEDTGKKHYDVEEMANQFENELSQKTECVVMCSIQESENK